MTNKIRELYDWLKTEGKDIEEECPESIVDAILDKIEESYLEEADPHREDPHREGSFFMSTPVVSRKYINDTFDTFFENNSRNFIEDRNNVVRQRIDSKGVLILNMEDMRSGIDFESATLSDIRFSDHLIYITAEIYLDENCYPHRRKVLKNRRLHNIGLIYFPRAEELEQ